jgi:DNA-binding NarL/FixJ family response regulator
MSKEKPVTMVALIADDDEFFRIALRAILTYNLGFSEVIEVGCFKDAVDKLSERDSVSLAIFDLYMPGMEGAETNVRMIRECFPRTQVVIVSSSKEKTDIIGALMAGAHGYIPKIIGISELSTALRSVLQGSIYVPSFLADLGAEHAEAPEPAFYPRPLPTGTEPVQLTPRQRQVLELLVQGLANKQMARALNLGEGTTKVHMAALFRTLRVASRAEAAAVGARIFAAE